MGTTENPYIDINIIKRIYETISKMEIELDDDPLILGPKRLNSKFAEAQRIRMSLSRLDLKIARFLSDLKRRFRLAELEYNFKKNYLLANDPETRAGKNLAVMQGVAQMKLKVEFTDLFCMGEAVREFEDILKIIRSRTRTIQDAQKQLKNQERMCDRELDLGSNWGSRSLRSGKSSLRLRHMPGVTDEVEEMISEVEDQYGLAAVKPTNGKVLSNDLIEEDDDVDEFLRTVDVSSMVKEDANLDDDEEIDIEGLLGG